MQDARLSAEGLPPSAEPVAEPAADDKRALITSKTSDTLAQISKIINSLGVEFAKELEAKKAAKVEARTKVRTLVGEVAQRRKALAAERSAAGDAAAVQRRIAALEAAIRLEDSIDYTGRLNGDGLPAKMGPAFEYRGPASLVGHVPHQPGEHYDADPPSDETVPLHQLRRLRAWYGRVIGILAERSRRLVEDGRQQAELESALLRIISRAMGQPIESLDDAMLERLLVGVQSDPQVDMARVGAFMQSQMLQHPQQHFHHDPHAHFQHHAYAQHGLPPI